MEKLSIGNKVVFQYWDNDNDKIIHGVGKITEIDEDGGMIFIQTTRTLHWLQLTEENENIQLYIPLIKAIT